MDDLQLLQEIEDALIKRITPPLAALDVRVFAGDRKDGAPVLDRDFLCIFTGSRFGNPANPFGWGTQDRVMVWQLSIRLKRLATIAHTEHYPIEQAVINAIKGYKPHDCVEGCFYPMQSRLVRRDSEGLFFYEILIAIKERFNG